MMIGTLRSLASRPAVRHSFLYGIPVLVGLLIAASIWASQIRARQAMRVLGQNRLLLGSEAVLRVMVLDLERQGIHLAFRAKGWLRAEGREAVLLFDKAPTMPPSLDAAFRVPPLPPGRATLVVEALTAGGAMERAETEVELVERWGAPEVVAAPEPPEEVYLPIRASFIGESYHVVPSIANAVFLRLSRPDGTPVQAGARLTLLSGEVKEALPHELKTDAFGLAPFLAYPLLRDLLFHVEVDSPEGPCPPQKVFIRGSPSSVLLRPDKVVLRRGEPLDLMAFTLISKGFLFVDLYRQGRWVGADKMLVMGGRGRLSLNTHPLEPGLWTVQASLNLNHPGEAVDTRAVLITGKGETTLEPLLAASLAEGRRCGDYLRHLKEGKDDDPKMREAHQVAVASCVDPAFIAPPLLADTQEEAIARAEGLKARILGGTRLTLAGLGGLVLLILAFAVAHGMVSLRRSSRGALEEGQSLVRVQALVEFAIILGIVALSLVMLLVLMGNLIWSV